jgi:hypothetical protein
MYAGCVAGALNKDTYLQIIADVGFAGVSIAKEKTYAMPDAVLLQYLSLDELHDYRQSGAQILSITVYGEKPSKDG